MIHGQGDGWVRGYEAATGKKLWEFDTNPKDSVWPKTRNEIISTPVVVRRARVPRERPGPRARRGRRPPLLHRPDQARRHHRERARLALRQDPPLDLDRGHPGRHPVPAGLQRLPARARRRRRARSSGCTTCWPRSGARRCWRTARSTWATRTATWWCMQAGKEKKVLAEMNMGSSVYSTPVPANGVLFIANRNQLFALTATQRPSVDGVRLHVPHAPRLRAGLARAPRRAGARARASGARSSSPTTGSSRPATSARAVRSLRGRGRRGRAVPRLRGEPGQRDGRGGRRRGDGSSARIRSSAWAAAARSTARRASRSWLTNGGTMADYRGYGKATRPLLADDRRAHHRGHRQRGAELRARLRRRHARARWRAAIRGPRSGSRCSTPS